jgi:DNA oxidative demethylase
VQDIVTVKPDFWAKSLNDREKSVRITRTSNMSGKLNPTPDGFSICAERFPPEVASTLIENIETLPLAGVKIRGKLTKRQVAQIGHVQYGYGGQANRDSVPFPAWMLELRDVAASVASIRAGDLSTAIVQKYPKGAGIGWHRDDPRLYGIVVGISLGGEGKMEFRPLGSSGGAASSEIITPRSVYVLKGSARWDWQHRIPAVAILRYSITYRTLLAGLPLAVPSADA